MFEKKCNLQPPIFLRRLVGPNRSGLRGIVIRSLNRRAVVGLDDFLGCQQETFVGGLAPIERVFYLNADSFLA